MWHWSWKHIHSKNLTASVTHKELFHMKLFSTQVRRDNQLMYSSNVFYSWMSENVTVLSVRVWKETWLKHVQTITTSLTLGRNAIKYLKSQMWWTLNFKSSKPFLCHLNQCRSIQKLKIFKHPPDSPSQFANKLPIFN